MLSVTVITLNESCNIAACLASVGFADQVVVVDSGSTDDTVSQAQMAGAEVSAQADWPGFGPQKNRALALATGQWVLSLDADERVSPELQLELLQQLARTHFDVTPNTERVDTLIAECLCRMRSYHLPVIGLGANVDRLGSSALSIQALVVTVAKKQIKKVVPLNKSQNAKAVKNAFLLI